MQKTKKTWGKRQRILHVKTKKSLKHKENLKKTKKSSHKRQRNLEDKGIFTQKTKKI